MIRFDNRALYQASLMALQRYTGRHYGRLVQIFLACKYYGALVPPIGAPSGISSAEIQHLLDDLYAKRSRPPQPSILALFNNNYLLPTGGVGAHVAGPSNNWRNNFNAQKGYSCFATAAELNNRVFRDQPRTACPHLRPAVPGKLNNATCALAGGAKYRGESHPKIFRLDPESREIFVHNPFDIETYSPIVAPDGRRLPIAPLVCALYHDSNLAAGRVEVDVPDFMLDFNFSRAEFAAYFDDDPASAVNADLIRTFPFLNWSRATAVAAPTPPARRGARAAARVRRTAPARAAVLPEDLPAMAHPIAPPAGGRWWDAEQAVKAALEVDGWNVIDRRRQGAGFDFQATKRGTTIFVEAKSSAGACSPTMTSREYREAQRLGESYFLAILENFDPLAAARILWVRNPANLGLSARTVSVYPIPRATWLRLASVDLE